MLAEKFFLVLETLLSRTFDDESAIVISSAAHIPVKLPRSKHQQSLEVVLTPAISGRPASAH
jgi:hypothetical protein